VTPARARARRAGVACALAALVAGAAPGDAPRPPGGEKTSETELLEAGAVALQDTEPVDQLSLWLVGFHPLRHDPSHQMEAHHFCRQVNQDFAQCALFDGGGEDARLNGIEYIVSEKLFETLPEAERRYWHPHNYEILSGQLVAPGIPRAAEHRLMASKIGSYGKTWHVWMSEDPLPYGDARLAWSFNRDGEARPELVRERDAKLGTDTRAARESRQDLAARAKPQCGVDVLGLPGDAPPPGVTRRTEGCPR